MSLIPVPALADNDLLCLLHDDIHALLVNPGDARPVMAAHPVHSPDLKLILVTRHHVGSSMRVVPKNGSHFLPATQPVARIRPFQPTCAARLLASPIIAAWQPCPAAHPGRLAPTPH